MAKGRVWRAPRARCAALEGEQLVRLSKQLKAWLRYASPGEAVSVHDVCRTLGVCGGRALSVTDLEAVMDAEYNRADHGRGRLVLVRRDWTRAGASALREEKAQTLWLANVYDSPASPRDRDEGEAQARVLERLSRRLKGWTRRGRQHEGLLLQDALRSSFFDDQRKRVRITRELLRSVLHNERAREDSGRGKLQAVDAKARTLEPEELLEVWPTDAVWIVNVMTAGVDDGPGSLLAGGASRSRPAVSSRILPPEDPPRPACGDCYESAVGVATSSPSPDSAGAGEEGAPSASAFEETAVLVERPTRAPPEDGAQGSSSRCVIS